MKVGLAGLGRMGGTIARRLLDLGCPLAVWNRSPEKAEELASSGVVVVKTAHDLAQWSDIVLSIVSDDEATRSLYTGESGLLTGAGGGKLFVEMSTLKPETIAALSAATLSTGARFIECPVMGTVGPARNGTLVALAGGDAEDVERAGEILRHLARRIIHTGGIGSACIMKLTVNSVLLTYLQALAEGLAFGTRGGLTAEIVLEVLAESPVNTPFLAIKSEMLRGKVLEPSEVGASLATVRKDMLSIASTASDLGVPMPAAYATLVNLSAACAAGWADREIAEIASFHRLLTAQLNA
jgi:3-hydroxyisobutyrate dehydrogenase-like beta-hydroxyacid dehydrogenase